MALSEGDLRPTITMHPASDRRPAIDIHPASDLRPAIHGVARHRSRRLVRVGGDGRAGSSPAGNADEKDVNLW